MAALEATPRFPGRHAEATHRNRCARSTSPGGIADAASSACRADGADHAAKLSRESPRWVARASKQSTASRVRAWAGVDLSLSTTATVSLIASEWRGASRRLPSTRRSAKRAAPIVSTMTAAATRSVRDRVDSSLNLWGKRWERKPQESIDQKKSVRSFEAPQSGTTAPRPENRARQRRGRGHGHATRSQPISFPGHDLLRAAFRSWTAVPPSARSIPSRATATRFDTGLQDHSMHPVARRWPNAGHSGSKVHSDRSGDRRIPRLRPSATGEISVGGPSQLPSRRRSPG